jgi:hypothetical protein
MTPARNLRPASTPTRVSELLLPTVISLLTRGPASAATFSTLLQPRPDTPATASLRRSHSPRLPQNR